MTADQRREVIPGTAGAEEAAAFDALLSKVRANLRCRRGLQGLAWCSAAVLVLCLGTIGYMDAGQFDAARVESARWVFYGAAAVLFVALVLVRALTRLTDQRLANYLEAARPEFDALLLSALEARERVSVRAVVTPATPAPVESPELDAALMARAAQRCQALELDRQLESPMVRRSVWAVVAIAAVTFMLGTLGPEPLRHGFKLLLLPTASASAPNPYGLDVQPGNVQLPYGADLRISARGVGFDPDQLDLYYRTGDDQPWQRIQMRAANGEESPSEQTEPVWSTGFEHYVFDLERTAEYYVSSGELRSSTYQVDVLPRPAITGFDVTYHFPASTGRPPETIRDAREISAVKGTRVELHAHPDVQNPDPAAANQPSRARLVIDDRDVVPLELTDDILVGKLEVEKSGHFRIEMALGPGELYSVTPELPLTALDDGLPSVSFLRPGRDAKVTAIEELLVEVQAHDDLAVRDLEVVLSVNGEDDRVVPLIEDEPSSARLSRSHRLYLEDLSLAPGDLIAYHARARDAAGVARRTVTTDIFFLEVRPFDNTFREAGGGGGGGGRGGGGQGGEDTLAAQQKSLVVALFKLVRDQTTLEPEDIKDRSEALAEAQGRIRARTDAISRRIGARTLLDLNDGYQQMARELPKASAEMALVQATLTVRDSDAALPSARKALLHLQRAFAAFREVQVARQGRQGSGRARANANDLANLFKLEMDRFRSQYDHVQRGSRGGAEQPLDAVMERLRELAQRQQREVERARARAQRGMGGAQSQRELIAELEAAVRELKRLTRERPDPKIESAIQELQAARDAMSRSGREADTARSQQALDRLRAARERLSQSRSGSLADGIEQSLQQSGRLLREQRDIGEAVRRMEQARADADNQQPGEQTRSGQASTAEDSGPGRGRQTPSKSPDESEPGVSRALADLLERKKSMVGDLGSLEAELNRLSNQSRQSQSDAAQGLGDARRALRGKRLAEQVEESRQRLAQGGRDRNGRAEGAIEQGLADVRDALARASSQERAAQPNGEGANGRGRQPGAGQAELSAELRELMRSMAQLNQRLREGASGSQRSGSQNGQTTPGGPGNQGGENRGPVGGQARGAMGGYDEAYAADIRQVMRRHGRTLERLRSAMMNQGHSAQDISSLISALAEFTGDDVAWADGERLSALGEQLLRQLQRAELGLRPAESEAALAGLLTAEPDQPPPDQERIAFEYYQRLSDTR